MWHQKPVTARHSAPVRGSAMQWLSTQPAPRGPIRSSDLSIFISIFITRASEENAEPLGLSQRHSAGLVVNAHVVPAQGSSRLLFDSCQGNTYPPPPPAVDIDRSQRESTLGSVGGRALSAWPVLLLFLRVCQHQGPKLLVLSHFSRLRSQPATSRHAVIPQPETKSKFASWLWARDEIKAVDSPGWVLLSGSPAPLRAPWSSAASRHRCGAGGRANGCREARSDEVPRLWHRSLASS